MVAWGQPGPALPTWVRPPTPAGRAARIMQGATTMRSHRLLPVLLANLLLGLLLWPLLHAAAQVDNWTVTGEVVYYGDLAPAADVEVSVHAAPGSAPLDSTYVPLPGGPFTFTNAPDGTAVFLSAYLDLNNSGGPPDPGEPLAWYDANHDGTPDAITITADVAGLQLALGDILYVDAQAAGAADGSSWADAYTDLQAALAVAPAGGEIWIAAGTYYPTAGGDRAATFQLHSGVAVYGGFAGQETLRQARRWAQQRTVLSGDIGAAGVATDNSYNVVTGSGVDRTAVLDGVTISGGYANGSGVHDKGGGLHNSDGSPTIANVTFIDNYAVNHGGAIANQYANSQPLIVNCAFSGNHTDWNGGGIANLWSAHPTIVNVTLTGNSGGNGGGIVNLEMGQATVRNAILHGNVGGEIGLQSGAAISVAYSLVQNGYPGSGNVAADPLFVDADGPDDTFGTPDDNLQLQLTSPAIDAADNAAVPADAGDADGDGHATEPLPLDLRGYPRFSDVPGVPDTGSGAPPLVDMGAYEAAALAGDVLVDRAGGVDAPDCGRGPNPACRTIPYAVSSVAAAGDRVLVMPGVYTESVTLQPGVDVVGLHGPALTVIDGEGVRGPLVIASGAVFSPAVTLQGLTIRRGSAPVVGGGVQVHDGARVVISDTWLVSNTAATLDGGISVRDGGAHLTLVNSVLRDNQNSALWVSAGTAVVSGCTFEHNQGGSWGGAIAAEANSTLTVHDTHFAGNSAGYGGAIVASETALTLTASRFYSNTAVSQGGALFVHANSAVLAHHNHFAGNAGGGSGGAIEIAASGGLLENNVLLRSAGAQVQIRDGADVTLRHNTLVGDGGGDGIRLLAGAQPVIANNLLTAHDVGITASGVVTPLLSHNLLWAHATAAYQQVAPGVGDLQRDPDLLAQTPDDVRLGVCSWAVDQGDNAQGAGDDYEGEARPVDGDGDGVARVDIGADERLTVTAPLPLAGFSSSVSGLTATFANTSQHGAGFAWDFGDGTAVVTTTHPAHTYAQAGTYTVTLTITGAFGCQDVLQQDVTVGAYVVYLPVAVRAGNP
ncbi:MAG: right-handed parallel beta-helix repeat-containing protein [Anaerolineales bacterium]|nr:right-handed parallel beta-helix repeat-containing protein [Anaerolineales bacterium]